MKTNPTTHKRVKKVFRFPKGISKVHYPFMGPFGWKEEADKMIRAVIEKYEKFPKKARIRFEYRLDGGPGTAEVQIYKFSLPPRGVKKKKK